VENVFIADLLPQTPTWDEAFAIGGFQPAGSVEPGGGWEWLSGELWSYTNWRVGEPNNLYGDEGSLEIYSHPATRGTWNDVQNTILLNGYIVEYTPEPAMLSLLGLGGLALIRRRRG
jgi:hypothetical protein